jgi:hypothetical protein
MTGKTGKSNTKNLLRALLAAAVLSVAFAAPAAAHTGPGRGLAAAGGCIHQCIDKALVTTTTTSARVEIETAVRTKVVVTARLLSSAGRIGGPAIKAVGPALVKARTLYLYDLRPARSYRITLAATDAEGDTAARSGTFTTKQPQTTGPPGVDGLSSGLGCSAKCITRAVPVGIGPTAAAFDVATNVPARITVITSRAGTGSIVSISTSPTWTKSYRHTASPLDPGTRYDLQVRATDANGHTEVHQFTFTTVERKARVTFWKIQVIEDGDPGIGDGELSFRYYLGGKEIQTDGFHKYGSGDVFDVKPTGSSTPGLAGVLPANGAAPKLDIRVFAEECDALLMKNCVGEVYDGVPSGGDADEATAGGLFGLNALVPPTALPGDYGTTVPSGHDAYLVFETTQYGVKFRVFATVDFFFAG